MGGRVFIVKSRDEWLNLRLAMVLSVAEFWIGDAVSVAKPFPVVDTVNETSVPSCEIHDQLTAPETRRTDA